VSDEILVIRCGTVPYDEAREAQRRLAEERQRGEITDVLLLLEHTPVYTRGRRSSPEELPRGTEWYETQGIEVRDTDRGGRVTYHGPGQLVAYPIVSLAPYGDDVHEYVRRLERVMIEALAEHGVAAGVIEGLTGVWTEAGARSARSASTSAAASPPTAWRSTSTTTCSPSSGSCPAGSRGWR
jgi:lipoyl(octanoyl) transferase